MNDINQMTNYQSMKDIRDQIGKDTPLKTDINKPYICDVRGRCSVSVAAFLRSAHGHQPKGTAVLWRQNSIRSVRHS